MNEFLAGKRLMTHLHAPRILLALAIAASLVASVRGDWPHLRGVNYDGVSADTGLADVWPAHGPTRLWSRDLGQGYSGFILAAGKLFTQRQTLGGQYLLCLDPDSGQTLWEYRYDWAWKPGGDYPGPYATPTWHRGKVYYASPTGLVGCVDADTGRAIWSFNVREKFHAKGILFGYAATPLVEDDKVILPVGGPGASLVALHVDDGRTVWAVGDDSASYCPAFPFTFQGRRCVAGYLQNALVLVELATGKLLHRQSFSAGYDERSAWPIYREPHLFLASPFRVPAARFELAEGPTDTLACKLQWLSKEMCNDVVSSVLHEGHLYGFDLKQLQASAHHTSRGTFKCLDWSTGKVRWASDEVGHASVIVADGKLLLLNDTGSLILARAEPASYQELARTQLFDGGMCWTPPLLWKGRLFARGPSQMICVYVGRPIDEPAGTAITTRPASGRAWRLDPAWLLSRERDYPNDAPSGDEMLLWFAVCVVFVFGGAALATALATRILHRLPRSPVFLGVAFILGLLGPNVFSALADQCLFTWPASLYAAFHATMLAVVWAAQEPGSRRTRWLARFAVAGFLVTAYGYFEACRSVGMFIGWCFLVGFPFAFPVTFLAVRATLTQRPRWHAAAWTLVAFTAYFWSSQALLLWKTAELN